ncbi:MAG: four helix bundle protein [Bacteroidetes bacterium CG02_land_8_20_14_3_00_31_25]|nr:four helix bundle protein [Bacteroidota bacterium]PIV62812.1 MAG: four helix bundle protein [Bacteroidetes bacterium CG02_land_8_20_14_3_00_31_25]PIX36170.1 MAG: four helix bundle protein [Bacteroidetes bacterium CG_4_8_14_3_um_filter_31_14]
MATFSKFEEIECWQIARKLCNNIFFITEKGPFLKDFRFKDQIRSSSGSVMDNIAEGFGRSGNKEFINFLSIAYGSACECHSQLYRAQDWKFISDNEFETTRLICEELISKISGLITYLRKSEIKGTKFH